MRHALPLLFCPLVLSCTTDTNFTRQQEDVEVVSGSGLLLLEPAEVDLWGLLPGVTTSETLKVQNVGDNNLIIYQARLIVTGGGSFYLPSEWSSTEYTVGPDQSLDMIIAATLAEEGTVEGTLEIKSNDEVELNRLIPLRATSDRQDTGITSDSGI